MTGSESRRQEATEHVVGVDIGGTFTDLVAIDPRSGTLLAAKTPTRPAALERGVAAGLREVGEGASVTLGEVRHGTTVVTNALLERRVGKTALLCTRGHRDILDLRRLWRERLFGYDWERPPSLIPRSMRFEINERIDARGEVLRPLDEGQVRECAARLRAEAVDAVAVAYLFSFRNSSHELATARILEEELPGVPISLSCDVLPEVHEYERTSTTVINAQVRPRISQYLSDLNETLTSVGALGPLRIVRSDGSLISPAVAADMPVRLVHSGPAVGVTGAARLAGWLGWQNVVTLDMGGTSTDVSLIWDGEPLRTFEFDLAWNIPVRATQIDIQSIGAGGGSIVGTGPGGRLFVGPRSAGAEPGPACYGRGGTDATVTDALLVLGALPDELLGGELRLDRAIAEKALLQALPEFADPRVAAEAVYTVTLHKMAVLTREVTINRGYDPRECVLVCFGGAGGLFAVDLAGELNMSTVYVPPAASVFSAVGAALARVSYEAIDGMFVHLETLSQERLQGAIAALSDRVRAPLLNDGVGVDENGKSDPADADAAASAVLSGEANGAPKAGDGAVEMIRALRVARTTAIRARTQAINALHALVITAPEELREDIRGLSGPKLVRTCAAFRPGSPVGPTDATKVALRCLAKRAVALKKEVQILDRELERLTADAAPTLLGIFGAGPETAGALLVAAGDNPERLRSEAAFAKLCGVSPVEASSGKTTRHRLNRGGDRHANAALYRIVLVRLRQRHEPTIDYVVRRTAEGKSKREIIRCLKRYVAREVYRALTEGHATTSSAA